MGGLTHDRKCLCKQSHGKTNIGGAIELTPDEQEKLDIENWIRELRDIRDASEKVEETIHQMLPNEIILRIGKSYERQKESAKLVLEVIQESLRRQ